GRYEFGSRPRREAGLETAINAVLVAPGVDRLLADPEVRGDLAHLASSGDQVHHAAPEFRRVPSSAHSCPLLSGQQHQSPVARLHSTQDTPEPPSIPARFTWA